MRISIAAITARRQGMRPGAARDLFQMYVDRIASYAPVDTIFADSEASLLDRLRRDAGRTASRMALLDSGGRPASSEAFASRIKDLRDAGSQQLVFAVGPASGWSAATRASATWLLSLGSMTLPHELALVVLAEQLYRAQTILAGHPYHSGH